MVRMDEITESGLTVNDGTQDRVAVGDLSGRSWQGQPLPPGTYGLWAAETDREGDDSDGE